MLKLANTQIKKLPETLNNIIGDLDLTDSQIEELPSILTIQGNFIVGNAPIKSLPADLIVTGNLDLTNSHIERVPNAAYIGGLILGKVVPYNPPELYNGRVTSKVVMIQNQIMPYRETFVATQRVTHEGDVKDTLMLYFGLSNDQRMAAIYKNKWGYMLNKMTDLTPIYKDIEIKKQMERIGLKYDNLKPTDMFTLSEIFPIYQDITEACDDAYEDFLKVIDMYGFSTKEKYSLSTWIEGSNKADYKYNYLFTEYFEKIWNKEEDAD